MIAEEPLPPDRNPALTYLARLAKGSRRAQASALKAIAAILAPGLAMDAFPWHRLRYQHCAAARAVLAERYRPTTGNRHLSALRGVLREAWRLDLIPGEEFRRAVELEPIRGASLPAGRELSRDELAALFGSCAADRTPRGARDAALIALLFGTGLRRSEAASLDLAGLDLEVGTLRVVGKGRKEREVPLPPGTRAAVEAWLSVRSDAPGPVICPVIRTGIVEVRQLTGHAVMQILRRRAEGLGLARFSPHDFRRSYVGHLLASGADLAIAQRLAGHASVSTTARYDRRGEEAKREAAQRLEVPFGFRAT